MYFFEVLTDHQFTMISEFAILLDQNAYVSPSETTRKRLFLMDNFFRIYGKT